MKRNSGQIVRDAFDAFLRNDVAALRDLVHEDLDWTFLDPSSNDPTPETCHGREHLEQAAAKWAKMGLTTNFEELEKVNDDVGVILHAPGLDTLRARRAEDLSSRDAPQQTSSNHQRLSQPRGAQDAIGSRLSHRSENESSPTRFRSLARSHELDRDGLRRDAHGARSAHKLVSQRS
jgi:hypothetical protein